MQARRYVNLATTDAKREISWFNCSGEVPVPIFTIFEIIFYRKYSVDNVLH
jgi:hypothetical protein